MPKKDYYNDPDAPAANSLIVAVAAVVRNEVGEVLMIERSDNGLWAIPGGAQEIGETTRGAAVREVEEETGLRVEVVDVTGIYSDPGHVIAYDDGEVRQEFSITFRAKPVSGELCTSSESKRVEWVPPSHIPNLNIHPSVRFRIDHALENRRRPYLT
ncbi:NUDIX domain-containing protein [Saccharopolyspora griseoalba]|uniref:NUDIX domain-containing protein n=1 Tax=Saccharopolyspora griseoalba TaxID=1431848 RepID=A0ABW2LLR3_9PSEU